MTPAAIRALASRVETEEPTDDLRAAVLTAFGSEAEWLTAPNPLVSVDDAKAFQPEGWRVNLLTQNRGNQWFCALSTRNGSDARYAQGGTLTEPRARTAAALHALAWEMDNAG